MKITLYCEKAVTEFENAQQVTRYWLVPTGSVPGRTEAGLQVVLQAPNVLQVGHQYDIELSKGKPASFLDKVV